MSKILLAVLGYFTLTVISSCTRDYNTNNDEIIEVEIRTSSDKFVGIDSVSQNLKNQEITKLAVGLSIMFNV